MYTQIQGAPNFNRMVVTPNKTHTLMARVHHDPG